MNEQKKHERVRAAIKDKGNKIKELLSKNDLSLTNLNILFVAYKENDELEIYAKKKNDKTYKKLFSYEICSKSGELGPKRQSGDYQVPEGFYFINRFNPTSNYHLSLGLNYPNQSDKKKSKFSNLGGDIFIHGSCVTIGCLPMTDEIIKEIYILAINAKNNGQQKIPVYIFPFKMENEIFEAQKLKYKNNVQLIEFWENLKKGYDFFLKNKMELKNEVDENGDYVY